MREIRLSNQSVGEELTDVLVGQLSNRLAEVFESARESNYKIARTMGIDPKLPQMYKDKARKPSLETLVKLFAAFENLSGEWLIKGTGCMTVEPEETEAKEPIVLGGIDQELVQRLIEENKRLSELNTMLVQKLASVVK